MPSSHGSQHDEESKLSNKGGASPGGQPRNQDSMQGSSAAHNKSSSAMVQNSVDLLNEMPPFKIGIIGCGHLGTMILTKLLEISGSFNNLKLMVSTR